MATNKPQAPARATAKKAEVSSRRVPTPPAKTVKVAARVLSAASHKGERTTPAKAAADRKAIQQISKGAATKTAAAKTPVKAAGKTPHEKIVQKVGRELQAKGHRIVGGKTVDKGLIKANPAKAAATKTPAKATAAVKPAKPDAVSIPKKAVSVVKRSGPQLKSTRLVETRPVVQGTAEKAFVQEPVNRTIATNAAAVIDRGSVMRELSGGAGASPTMRPVPSGTSEKAFESPAAAAAGRFQPQTRWVPPVEKDESLLRPVVTSGDSLQEAHELLHPSSPATTVAPAPTPAPTPKHRANHGLHAPRDLPSGINNLAAGSTGESTTAALTPRPADGHPATSENIGAQTAPQPSWRSALTATTPAPQFGGAPASSAPVARPVSTGHAPGLIERRFEVIPEGLAAYRWKLVDATTGHQISVSKETFGTPDAAAAAASEESKLYRPGTSLVLPLQGAQRY